MNQRPASETPEATSANSPAALRADTPHPPAELPHPPADTAAPDRIAIEQAIGLRSPSYTLDEAAGLAGCDTDFAIHLWRSMGFPDPAPDERFLNDEDVASLRVTSGIITDGFIARDQVLEVARTLGSAMARVAEVQVRALEKGFAVVGLTRGEGLDTLHPDQLTVLVDVARDILPVLESSLVYVWRRHLGAAARRALLTPRSGNSTVIAFADLVDFTARSEELDQSQLTNLISGFEHLAFDAVASQQGRIIKLIGDEVMFTAPSVEAAAEAAWRLIEGCAADELLPSIRVGLAAGPTVTIDGDHFGPSVNLAARITPRAYPNTILAPADLRDAIVASGCFEAVGLRQERRLKGIGAVRLVSIRRAAEPSGGQSAGPSAGGLSAGRPSAGEPGAVPVPA